MKIITLEEMERDFSGHMQSVRAGESFLINQADKLIAELRPVTHSQAQLRPFGLCRREFKIPSGFDDPLPYAVFADFENK